MNIVTFDYDGYLVEVCTKDAEFEQERLAESQRIQREYAEKGIQINLGTARYIAIFNADEDLYFDDDQSDPSGLDPDRKIPSGLIQRIKDVGLETAVLEQAIADAYGCAVNCKPSYSDTKESDFAFPSEDAWVCWHMETISNAVEWKKDDEVMGLPEAILEEIKAW